jgi:hypothetical protein
MNRNKDKVGDMIDERVALESMSFTPEDGLNIRARHPAFAAVADAMAEAFEELGATNYLELTLRSAKLGNMTLRLQRADGETPAQQNEKLRQRIAELEARLAI